MSKIYYVYILASQIKGTLYIGVTSNLLRRVCEHREGKFSGFTKKYGVHRLVYFDSCDSIQVAIDAEKRLKKWNRNWKVRIIEEFNPGWEDLYERFVGVV